MHPATPSTRLAPDAYHRGTLQYEKTVTLLNRLYLIPWIIALPGIAVFYCAAEITYLPHNTSNLLLLAGVALIVTGALIYYIMHRITKRHRYHDFTYRIALYFMKELGHANPAQTLTQNPQYLAAFQEIITAVKTELTAAGKPHAIAGNQLTTIGLRLYETISPAHWIGSLVLANEHSLQQAPRLLSLIKDQHLTDYDQLATMMETTS